MARRDAAIREGCAKFVCVRMTHMRGVDLDLFQFDYDMTWAGFFMNADGAIYGRYGSRTSGKKGADSLISTASFRRALERALELHAGYPGNKAALAGKRGAPLPWSSVEKMPSSAGKFAEPGDKGCIHCHHASTGLRRSLAMTKQPIPDPLLWTWPLAENVGMRLDLDEGNRIVEVRPGTAAAKAGLRTGDVVAGMNGQTILSHADVQWVLQNAPDRGDVKVDYRRDAASAQATLALDGPWRRTDLSWRESMWDARPGLWLVGMTADERAKAGLAEGVLGLRIKWVIPRGLARKAGFQDGDVLVEFDGKTEPMDESLLVARVRQQHAPGSKIPVAVLRGGKRLPLTLEVD